MDAHPTAIDKDLGGTEGIRDKLHTCVCMCVVCVHVRGVCACAWCVCVYVVCVCADLATADGAISSRFSMLHSSKNSKMGLGCDPTLM